MGKVQNNQNWAFMIILNHFKQLWWEKNEEKNGKIKIGHSQSFLTILVVKDKEKCEVTKIGYSESFRPIWWEKMGKSVKWPKLGTLNHFGPIW